MKLHTLAAAAFITTASASTNLVVCNNSDAGPGSFRQAILDANSLGGATINFRSVTGTITLQSRLPLLTANMIIMGPGAAQLTITRATGSVFTNSIGNTVSCSGLRLTGGDEGVLRNFGTLVMNECMVANGRSPGEGAGILNSGTMYLNNSIVTGNDSHGGDGGGIFNSGTMTLENCWVTNNASGGVFNNSGSLTMNSCIIAGNQPSGPGGGSGIGNYGGTVVLRNCAVTNNTAVSGGGIWNGGWLTVMNSTVAGNVARYSEPIPGGGIFNFGTAVLVNTTISGNNTSGTGGGIHNQNTLVLLNSTIVSNVAGAGPQGGGIWSSGTATAQNSILAGNTAPQGPDFYGTFFSDGFNLIQNTNMCIIVGITTGNIIGMDPRLGPLRDNGGPTWTHALLPGSPAIDSGSSYGAPSADQRGVPRPQGVGVDIGAFEFQQMVPSFVSVQCCPNLSLRVWGLPGATCALEASANFSQWLKLTNFSPGPNGLWDFVGDDVASYPIRFFRINQSAP